MEERRCVVESGVGMLAAVNERRLLILAAVGASVVAYVVYALLSRSVEAPPQSKRRPAVSATADASPDEEATPRRRKAPSKRAALPGKRRAAPLSGGPPPALPMPDISLDEAREDYRDLLTELERELERNKETGKAIANKHWVEYYRRGHEVMTPLRRYLSVGSEEGKTEVAGMDAELRDIMGKLQTDPAKLEDAEADADEDEPAED